MSTTSAMPILKNGVNMISFVDVSGSAATNRCRAKLSSHFSHQRRLEASGTEGFQCGAAKPFSHSQRPPKGNYLQVGKNPSKKFRFFIWLKQSVAKTIDYPLKQLGT
jgi:hypothetical protein